MSTPSHGDPKVDKEIAVTIRQSESLLLNTSQGAPKLSGGCRKALRKLTLVAFQLAAAANFHESIKGEQEVGGAKGAKIKAAKNSR